MTPEETKKFKKEILKMVEDTIKNELSIQVQATQDRRLITTLTWSGRPIKQVITQLPKSTMKVVQV